MKKERLTEDEILIAMEPGVHDILTVTDSDLVDPKGIRWVKQGLNGSVPTKDACIPPKNGRFNREMNAAFKPHPKMRQFVSTIGRMSSAYAKKQASTTRGLRRKKQLLPRIALPPVPDLTEFEVPPESDSNEAGFERV
ncbi:hypothetical protein L916_10553 [Phytophthora nicotianae]|uniref:Uncharacterized protein n=1 Tax=Phytophthora nicotianae TaxID=4792 RepID=W2IW90_PHYNI|nr:hypothetical protein L916_10553 [Phytophthora nicotianae]